MQTTEVSANYIKCIDHRFFPSSVMFLFYIASASCGPSAFLAADSEIRPNASRPPRRAGLRVGSAAPGARTAPRRAARPGSAWLGWSRLRRWRAPFPTRCDVDGKDAVLVARSRLSVPKGQQKLTPGSPLEVPLLTRQASICLVVSAPRGGQGFPLCVEMDTARRPPVLWSGLNLVSKTCPDRATNPTVAFVSRHFP